LQGAMETLYASVTMGGVGYDAPSVIERMSGTPLVATIVVSRAMIRRFQKTHRIQKTVAMFLTDGESGILNSVDRLNRKGCLKFGEHFISGHNARDAFKALRKQTDIVLVGFRLSYKGDSNRILNRALNSRYSEVSEYCKRFKANGVAHLTEALGYDHFFLLDRKTLDVDDTDHLDLGDQFFDATDRKSATKLARLFKTSAKARKESRKFLSIFSDIIA